MHSGCLYNFFFFNSFQKKFFWANKQIYLIYIIAHLLCVGKSFLAQHTFSRVFYFFVHTPLSSRLCIRRFLPSSEKLLWWRKPPTIDVLKSAYAGAWSDGNVARQYAPISLLAFPSKILVFIQYDGKYNIFHCTHPYMHTANRLVAVGTTVYAHSMKKAAI